MPRSKFVHPSELPLPQQKLFWRKRITNLERRGYQLQKELEELEAEMVGANPYYGKVLATEARTLRTMLIPQNERHRDSAIARLREIELEEFAVHWMATFVKGGEESMAKAQYKLELTPLEQKLLEGSLLIAYELNRGCSNAAQNELGKLRELAEHDLAEALSNLYRTVSKSGK